MLRSWALRRAPAFLSLLFLLLRVTRVLETIFSSYHHSRFSHMNRFKYLLSVSNIVKGFALGLFIFINGMAQATETTKPKDIILSIGQHYELHLPMLGSFSLGNTNALSHKWVPAKHRLLIRARKLGFTELVVWQKDGKKQTWAIHVLERRRHQGLAQLMQSLPLTGARNRT